MSALSQSGKKTAYQGEILHAAVALLNRMVIDALGGVSGPAGTAMATNTTGVKTVNSVTYSIDGVFQTAKGATDNFWTLGGGVLAVNSFRHYLLCIQSGGTALAVASSDASATALCRYVASGTPPTLPWDAAAIISYCTVATDATHTFTPGTTALNATGITATYADGIDKNIYPVLSDATSGYEELYGGGGPNSLLG